jgi:hypothetical protein
MSSAPPANSPALPTTLTQQDILSLLHLTLQTLQTEVATIHQPQSTNLAAPTVARPTTIPVPVHSNLSDPDNLAGTQPPALHFRLNNPVPRPSALAEATPALFDLSHHSGARKVKACLRHGSNLRGRAPWLRPAPSFTMKM